MAINWLDRTITFFAPATGAKRAKARVLANHINQYARKYEGASIGRRTSGWQSSNSSANDEVQSGRKVLMSRARDLVRNNPHAANGVAVIQSNIVGDGIVPAISCEDKAREKNVTDIFRKWAERPTLDADGRHNLYSMQSIAVRAMVQDGDVFIRRRRRRAEDNLPVPMQLQILEGDYLNTDINWIDKRGNRAVNGIELDALGRRVAYHFFREHPGSSKVLKRETVRVPANDVIHLYRPDRPGQQLGASWFSPVIIRLRDFDEYEDAQLMKQKVSACMAAFVYDADYDGGPLGDEDSEEEEFTHISPGGFHYMGPGKKVETSNPPSVSDYDPFSRRSLQAVASGLGVPYEALTGDLANVNFSSGRMGWLEFQRRIDQWRWNLVIPILCETLWDWFVEELQIMGINTAGVESSWTPPARQMIDPTKEFRANSEAVRSGQKTLSEVLREQGMDPKKVFEERAEEQKLLDKLGIILDSDPRKINLAGSFQVPNRQGGGNASAED